MSEEAKKGHKEQKPLEKMTITELREIARDIPHTEALADMSKEQLVALIKEFKGLTTEPPGRRVPASLGEIKGRIRQLKAEREAAREDSDRDRSEALRRRISRLKKRSRRLAAG